MSQFTAAPAGRLGPAGALFGVLARRRARLARALLLCGWVVATVLWAACLPPDFEVEPDVNEPVMIDTSKLHSPPDFYGLFDCDTLEIDIAPAISDPDGDPLTVVWLMNPEPGVRHPTLQPDSRQITLDPCSTDRLRADLGIVPNKLELIVYDRKPLQLDNAVDAQTIVDPTTTQARAVWFIGVQDTSCCGP